MNPPSVGLEYALKIDAVEKSYGTHRALHSTSIGIRSGEFLAIVGPSGSGKSTLLKIIGGFEVPTAGKLRIEGRDITDLPPAERPTRMVFQRLALFPHMTVAENIGYPLKVSGETASEINDRVDAMLALMHLNPAYKDRLPGQLSGGEQQRVALARSMVSSPRMLLLDEPLSALDAKLKKDLQAELRALHRTLGVTFVHVTHDLEEAMILADRICVMRLGRIEQIGRPADIYYRPKTAFVARFIGETNLLPVETRHGPDGGVQMSAHALSPDSIGLPSEQVDAAVGNGAALAMIRPEHLKPVAASSPGVAPSSMVSVKAVITEVFDRGAVIQYRAEMVEGGLPLVFETHGGREPVHPVGETLTLAADRVDIFVLPVGEGG